MDYKILIIHDTMANFKTILRLLTLDDWYMKDSYYAAYVSDGVYSFSVVLEKRL